MIMLLNLLGLVKGIWNKIPQQWRDWSKSESLNFIKEHTPGIFAFFRDKIRNLWAKVPNSKVKTVVDKATSTFISLNNKISPDIKRELFEHITGSQYNPDSGVRGQALTEMVLTDEEKKAAAIQLSYFAAILGEVTQEQESLFEEYMSSLRMADKLKQDILNEMQEAEKEFAKFTQELSRLDEEFHQISSGTKRTKEDAIAAINRI